MDPPTVKQIVQAIDMPMQTTHNQSRSEPARTAPPVRTGALHVIRVARRPTDVRDSKGARTGAAKCDSKPIGTAPTAGIPLDGGATAQSV